MVICLYFLHNTADHRAVTSFTLATNEEWKDQRTGEKRERTEWHRLVFFGKVAEIAAQYLHTRGRVRAGYDRELQKHYGNLHPLGLATIDSSAGPICG
ncbi:MAG: single-stranded DNA-binding protein [Gammaproteobacteria bacterium]|nr:single-stranded DNA-binding protein [Gammaproteobacteria bacterium]